MNLGGRLPAAVLVSTLLGGGAVVLTATPAAAEGGLAESGHSRYVVSDKGAPVRVTTTVTVTNRVPSSGGRYTYWSGYPLFVPNGASGVKATSGGASLPVRVEKDGKYSFAAVRFPNQLLYGQSRTITVTYSIKGAPPRSKAYARVGRGFAAIDVFSPGDAGRASIDIVSPRWMTLDTPDTFSEKTDGDTRTATITGGGSGGLLSSISMRDISQALSRKVTVDKATFTVQAFPGDKAWSNFVADRLPTTVRTLKKITGQNWPDSGTAITEDYSSQVYGWDGQYTRTGITVAEDLDHALLAHELAHAWANDDHLAERWLVEGLAQELATETTAALKAKDAKRPTVRPSQKGAIPLTTWTYESSTATATEDYGYPASWRAVHSLVTGSEAGKRPEVLRMLTSSRSVYDTAGDRSVAVHPTTWKQAYDIVEVAGGNRSTKALMTQWVVGKGDAAAITLRGQTRATYAARDSADGTWAPPRGVRAAMYDWNFADAQRELVRSAALAPKAVAAQKAATSSGLPDTGVRHAYEVAVGPEDYRAVEAQLTAFTGEATRYAGLRADTDSANPLARLGALVLRPSQPLADARAAVVKGDTKAADRALDSAESRASWSTKLGAGIVVLLLLLGAGAWLLARRRRRRPAPIGAAEPESAAPETAAPETAAPETAAPETSAPETAASETSASPQATDGDTDVDEPVMAPVD